MQKKIFRDLVKRMSIPFVQVCENTCSIDLSVTANLAPSFQSPFVIGSSSFVTLIFTVINIGIDPAYLPVLKIPLGTKRILQTPPRCETFFFSSRSLRRRKKYISFAQIKHNCEFYHSKIEK